ncbi:helix-turn-helix transcriptional regulator [Urechidicola sp. KH5]
MVNNQEFSKRLKSVLEHYNLSATAFAEKIDVQRSSISHLLSGRNKPSLDFVLKVLKVFPDIELYWLMNGDGSFPSTKIKGIEEVELDLFHESPQIQEQQYTEKRPSPINIKKEIERIVICYSDGTFSTYLP